jgi:hypothetical protein
MDLGITGRTALVIGAGGVSAVPSPFDSPKKGPTSPLAGGQPTSWPIL